MNYLFLAYPNCVTCKNAQKWLDQHGIAYTLRHIVEDRPTAAEIKAWHAMSGLPLRRFFNTSGLVYKSLKLKDRLDGMGDEEQVELLASNGMLVRRPILVGDDFALVGFKPPKWEAKLLAAEQLGE